MTQAEKTYENAYANLGGVGLACFLSRPEQEQAFNEAFKRLAVAAQSYVPELKAEIRRLKSEIGRQKVYVD